MPADAAPRLLVVNADDFGISPGVNRGIVAAHLGGLVTSASLMPNLPSAADALERAAECQRLGLGIHLTLTAGRPLSPTDLVSTLVDGHGRFQTLGTLLVRLSLGRVRRADLERELTAQVEWVLEREVRPDHLDSHHHVHVHPRLVDLVLDLAERHRIPFVRCPDEMADPRSLHRASSRDAARALAISPFARLLRGRLRRRAIRTTASFRGISLGMGFAPPALVRALRSIPPGLTELMTHPGYPDAELARLTSFVKGRDRELAALMAPETRAAVERGGIRLTHFREAAEPPTYT